MVLDSPIPAGRECTICGVFKPFTEFRKKARGLHGHAAQCKPCSNAKLDVWRARTRERRLAYNREYYRSDRGRAVTASWHSRNPTKRHAQMLMWRAVAAGELVKPEACETCGAVARLDGHHPDYAKPLDVMWLCRDCHKAWHRKHGEGLNADFPVPPANGLLTQRVRAKMARLPLVAAMRAAGMLQKDIAAHFGVTQATICDDLKRISSSRG